MNTNIPIYRAKKIDSDDYVEGYYFKDEDYHEFNFILDKYCREEYQIDPSTLSISFPDMLDKNNKRIFASLSEDGNGGDIVKEHTYVDITHEKYHYPENVFLYKNSQLSYKHIQGGKNGDSVIFWLFNRKECIEVTGIYEGEKQ